MNAVQEGSRGLPGRGFAALGVALEACMLALVALTLALVAARYLFDLGSIAAQEATQWLHAAVFMLGAALALRGGAHVRVDVLHARWSPRTQALVELAGTLVFLLPFAAFMAWISLDYVVASWQTREGSRDPGGLPGLYLLKTLIPLSALLLILQGLAELGAAWRRLR